jgi:hypothetical protein
MSRRLIGVLLAALWLAHGHCLALLLRVTSSYSGSSECSEDYVSMYEVSDSEWSASVPTPAQIKSAAQRRGDPRCSYEYQGGIHELMPDGRVLPAQGSRFVVSRKMETTSSWATFDDLVDSLHRRLLPVLIEEVGCVNTRAKRTYVLGRCAKVADREFRMYTVDGEGLLNLFTGNSAEDPCSFYYLSGVPESRVHPPIKGIVDDECYNDVRFSLRYPVQSVGGRNDPVSM